MQKSILAAATILPKKRHKPPPINILLMVLWRIALRYLFSKKSHNAVNIISLISVAGVATATAAIICVLSVFNGFADIAFNRLSLISPDLKVTPIRGKVIDNVDSLLKNISAAPEVVVATPVIEDMALAMYRGRQMPVKVKGVKPDYQLVSHIDHVIIDGDYILRDSVADGALVSVGVAVNTGVRPDFADWFALYAPRRFGKINAANPMAAFRSDSILVAGVYEVNEGDYDLDRMIVDYDVAARLFDFSPSEASFIEIASLPNTVDALQSRLQASIGQDYNIENRLQQGEQSFKMISIEKWITFVMLAFILAIASFNVVSTLSMLIIEKRDNMATLRSLGASRSQISRIFFIEGWLISILGGIVGIVIGIALCLAQQFGGFIKIKGDPSQLSITEYPVHVQPLDVLIVLALIIFTGALIATIASRISSTTK